MKIISAVLVAVALAIGAVAPAQAEQADAEFPFQLGVQGSYGTSSVAVAVPEGASPVQLTGTVVSTYLETGSLVFTVNGGPVAELPLTGGPLTIPLTAADLRDGAITVGMAVRVEPTDDCFRDESSTAVLRDAVITYDLPTQAPTSIRSFLSDGVRSFTVAVPADPNPAEQQAGLDAALALRHAYSAATTVDLVAGEPPTGTFTDRVVVVAETDEPANSLTVAGFQLIVAGSGAALSSAAVSIADPNTALIERATVSDLTGSADFRRINEPTSFAQIGIAPISLTGFGRNTVNIDVPQATFGGPISNLELAVRGNVTPLLPGQQGRIDFLWNNQLVDSIVLSENLSQVVINLNIPAKNLLNANTLTMAMTLLPGDGNCANPGVPGRVDIDAERSRVIPTFGNSQPPGFQRFPQVFEATIPVALSGSEAGLATEQAATLLLASTSISPQQYVTQIGAVADQPKERARVVVGATPADAQDLKAPILSADQVPSFPAAIDEPYATLQAFAEGPDVLLLGASNESAQALATQLVTAVANEPWPLLAGQVYVYGANSAAPEAFALPPTEPDTTQQQEQAAAILTVALVLGVILWMFARPKGKPAAALESARQS